MIQRRDVAEVCVVCSREDLTSASKPLKPLLLSGLQVEEEEISFRLTLQEDTYCLFQILLEIADNSNGS
jgi:hypothetical protein